MVNRNAEPGWLRFCQQLADGRA